MLQSPASAAEVAVSSAESSDTLPDEKMHATTTLGIPVIYVLCRYK